MRYQITAVLIILVCGITTYVMAHKLDFRHVNIPKKTLSSHHKRLWIQTVWLVVVVLMIPGCELEKPIQNSSVDEFSSYLRERIPVLMQRYDIPGLSVVLVQNGESLWEHSYGYADLSTGRKMTTDTICRVESISKSVTARGVLQLVEEGDIDLDEPIVHYLKSWNFPESPYDETKITLRQLLSHQSGLPLGPIGMEYSPAEEKPSLKESLNQNAVLKYEPGSKFSYSNVGYHLIELLIEEVTGRDFSDYMRDQVLEPLHMNQSNFEWSVNFKPRVPMGYDLNGNPVSVYVYSEKGSGGLFASAKDIARFMVAGMNEKGSDGNADLSQSYIDQMYEPSAEISGIYSFVSESYGFGHFIDSLANGQISVFGGGQGHGWMTHFQSIPESGDGIVILTNSQRSWPLIGYILKYWAEWRGDSSVGMARIADAVIGIWVLIGGLILGSIYQALRLGHQIKQKYRHFAPLEMNNLWVRSLQFMLFVSLTLSGLWILNQEYIFLFSIFPIASGWLIITILLVATVFLFTALFPERIDRMRELKKLNRREY